MLATKFAVQSLGAISMLFLVRILTPDDFGIIAMVMAAVAFIALFGKVGVESYLIQKEDPTEFHYHTAWSINFFLFCFVGVLIYTFAPAIANYYDDARLEPVTRTISLLFFIRAANNIRTVDFRKHLNFHLEFKYRIYSKSISLIASISLAYWLENYWALVYAMILIAVVELILGYLLIPFSPKLSFSRLADIFGFAKWTSLQNIFIFINLQGPIIILGFYFSSSVVGVYAVSLEMASIFTIELVAAINAAAFPVFSKLSQDLSKLRSSYLGLIETIYFIFCPIAVGLFAVSDLFVPIVLGEKWIAATEILGFITLYAGVVCLNSTAGYMYLAIGKPKYVTFVTIYLSTCVVVACIFGGVAGDVRLAVVTLFILSIPVFFINIIISRRYINISLRSYVASVWRPLIASLIMLFTVTYVRDGFLSFHNVYFFELAMTVVVGAAAYLVAIILLWRFASCPAGVESKVLDKMRQAGTSIFS